VAEHAALATADPRDPLANQVATEAMAATVNQVNQENAVTQLHPNHQSSTDSHLNALAKPHQASKDQLDQKDPTDHQAKLEPQAPMVKPATKDHAVHQARTAKTVLPVKKVLPEMLAKPLRKPDQPDQPEAQAKLAVQAQPEPQAPPAKTVVQAAQVALEMLVHQEQPASQAAQAPMVMQANKVTQEAAPTAHRLVWPQDIKSCPDRFRSFHGDVKFKYLPNSSNILLFSIFIFHYLNIGTNRCKLAFVIK